MYYIDLQATPNQQISITLEDHRYEITIKTRNGIVSCDISRDETILIEGVRITAGTALIPYRYLYMGNFILTTENEELPDYTKFESTQQLIYLTIDEVNETLADEIVPESSFAPSLSFDFVDNQSTTSAEGFIGTFTRASVASYYNSSGLVVYATANLPRFDYDPTTLIPYGLLMESASSNVATYSEQFDNGVWVKNNSTVSANSVVAPDGNSTGDFLLDTNSNSVHEIDRNFAFVAGQAYTFSVHARGSSITCMKLALPSVAFSAAPTCFFNLQTGAMGTPSGCTAGIKQLPNFWYRVTITATATASTSGNVIIGLALDLSTNSYTGNGSGIYVWGAQLEQNVSLSSYIVAAATAVTRASEAFVVPTSGWLASQVGTLYTEAEVHRKNITTGRIIAQLNDGTGNNLIEHFVDGTNANDNTSAIYNAGANQFVYAGAANTFTSATKIATGYHTNAATASIDSQISPFDSAVNLSNYGNLNIGSSFDGSQVLNGWIKNIQYYPIHLQNNVLSGMTA